MNAIDYIMNFSKMRNNCTFQNKTEHDNFAKQNTQQPIRKQTAMDSSSMELLDELFDTGPKMNQS